MRILLAEDNTQLATWTQRMLEEAGYVIEVAKDGQIADACLQQNDYALLILDIGLPKLDGFDVLKRLRRRGQSLPVLMLTALTGVDDRVHGLDLGADDYLGKPFEKKELEARIRALLRRSANASLAPLQIGDLRYSPSDKQCLLGHDPLPLTKRETAVLEVLLYRQGKPVSKEMLLEQIVNLDQDLNAEAMEIYIHRLRKKLQGSGVQIVTVRGLGYVLCEMSLHAE